MNSSPFKISTITATASLNCTSVNLFNLYNAVPIIQNSGDEEGFCYIEFGEKKGNSYTKGYHKKMSITRRKEKQGKRFDNQVTMTIRHRFNDSMFVTNMKIFKNGNVQMTGLKTIPQGKYNVDFIVNFIKKCNREFEIVEDESVLECKNYRVRLINSDFKVDIEIRRDRLHKIIQKEYGFFCSYEPCIYPGVKIQYSFNEEPQACKGICDCKVKCNGKGDGNGQGNCKRVTISVFQSGCIIITGAQTVEQIDITYNVINSILRDHKEFIEKKDRH